MTYVHQGTGLSRLRGFSAHPHADPEMQVQQDLSPLFTDHMTEPREVLRACREVGVGQRLGLGSPLNPVCHQPRGRRGRAAVNFQSHGGEGPCSHSSPSPCAAWESERATLRL